jgi:hypothetical protein
MKTHLHKLSEGFIITSDEEIEEYDRVFDVVDGNLDYATDRTNYHKHIYSKVIAQQDRIDFSSLSIDEQKEIGWFDVVKLGWKAIDEGNTKTEKDKLYAFVGYFAGFLKAQELLSDKLFTLDDVVKIVHLWDNHINIHEEDKGSISTIKEFIESLSQPKSWKVEIEMEDKIALDGHTIIGREPKLTSEGKIKIITFLTLNEKYS